MLEKCLVSLEKCSVLLENFFEIYARDRSVIARNFLMLEMLDHFSARDRSDRKFKIKNCAQDRSVIARNFFMLEMLDHFSAQNRSDQKIKIKNYARDHSDRKFQCSKCLRSMLLPLGLNSNDLLLTEKSKLTNDYFSCNNTMRFVFQQGL